ncbi:MAG: putative competence protein ComF [Firmicutes bacterium]|nr:putative competence protein ComF [Bacillota bacterium]
MVLQGLMDLLWPPRTECLLCGAMLAEEPLPVPVCEGCWEGMHFPPALRCCFNCARPLSGGGTLCRICAAGSPFGYVYALGLHEGALREAIHHLKFGDREELAPPLGRRLAALISTRPDCLVPVPLHRSRLVERGYNQATLIAQAIAAELSIPVVDTAMKRLRRTGHQAKLDRAARMKNLQHAFGVSQTPAPWAGKSVLLVDDVLTTGATAAAVANVLRQTGARTVDMAVLAVSATTVRGILKITIND